MKIGYIIEYKNMRLFLILALCADLTAKCVLADGEYEVKRGGFPYMAFVYYPDKTVIDGTGARFMRAAVLLRPDWLITSALENGDTPLSFPKKTLVARLGAVRIDNKFTFNEDEDEQEREIIQIDRPRNFSATEWWSADISLLKTLLAFNITKAVALASIATSPMITDKSCFILVYAAINSNASGDRILMQLSIEMLQPTTENCGSNFMLRNMLCATDSDETRKYPNFCEGNSGGPLVCENDVLAIQTYTHDCKPPYLYQIVNSWDNLITCSLEDKCKEENCATICKIIDKDSADEFIQEKPSLDEDKLHSFEDDLPSTERQEVAIPLMEGRRVQVDNSNLISDNLNNISNTETFAATVSEAHSSTEPSASSDTDSTNKPTPTVNEHSDEDQESASIGHDLVITFNPEMDNSTTLKTVDIDKEAEEDFKNLINSRMEATDNNEHKVRSAASGDMQRSYRVMSIILLIINFT